MESLQKIVDAQQKVAINDKLNRLDERLAKVEQTRSTGGPDAGAGTGGPDPAAQGKSQAPSDEEYVARWQEEFERQPYDPTWAVSAKQRFEQDFTKLGTERQLSLKAVECRSSGCIAIVEFDNYATALKNYMALIVETVYSIPCATSGAVPPPDEADKDKPYQTTIYFKDCQK
jgi:hypothetical protein